MKTKQKQELRAKSSDELQKLLQDEQKSLQSLQVDHAQFMLKNTRSLFLKRKEIAVIQTYIVQKRKEEKK